LFQVAHHDPVGVTYAERHLVNADDLWRGLSSTTKLLAQILFLQLFDRLPV
jgi:hypothetical protein